MPRPGSSVVHSHLVDVVRAVSEAAMPDTIAFVDERAPEFNEADGTYRDLDSVSTYDGPCRIEPRPTAERVVEIAGVPVSLRTYDIYLPADVTTVQLGHIGTPAATRSAWLAARRLRVVDVTGSSLEGERHLVCEDDLS